MWRNCEARLDQLYSGLGKKKYDDEQRAFEEIIELVKGKYTSTVPKFSGVKAPSPVYKIHKTPTTTISNEMADIFYAMEQNFQDDPDLYESDDVNTVDEYRIWRGHPLARKWEGW
tara:strand:+ start:145 stop:489 length:345 start_codon:yes stop_codon:yes gene_type:complete